MMSLGSSVAKPGYPLVHAQRAQPCSLLIAGPMGNAYVTLPCCDVKVILKWGLGEYTVWRKCRTCKSFYLVKVAQAGGSAEAILLRRANQRAVGVGK